MQNSGNPNDPDDVGQPGDDHQSPVAALEERIKGQLAKTQSDYQFHTKNDQDLSRKDTVEVCVDILKRIKDLASEINK